MCLTCHRLDEPFDRARARGATRRYPPRQRLESWFTRASGTMPAVGSTWTDDQIDALVAYTKGLVRAMASPG